MKNRYTSRPLTEREITRAVTATPLEKHIMFYREFKPLEVELISYLIHHTGKHTLSEIATALGHDDSWGTNFRKAALKLENRGYLIITRENCNRHTYHYQLSDKFINTFVK